MSDEATDWAARLWRWCRAHCPPAGYPAADPTDERMTGVVLALALHDAARVHDYPRLAELPFHLLAAVLADRDARYLLLRAAPALGEDLRPGDRDLLDDADDQQWQRWTRTAGEVIAAAAYTAREQHGTGHTMPTLGTLADLLGPGDGGPVGP